MENENQKKSPSPPVNPQSDTPNVSDNKMKIVQPSQDFVDEVKNDPSITKAKEHTAPINQTPIKPPNTITEPPEPLSPIKNGYNPASIYPTAVNENELVNRKIDDENKEKEELDESTALVFKNGWRIGSSIFWIELIVGIIAALIFWAINYALIYSKNLTVIFIFSWLELGTFFYLGIRIPYKQLSIRNIKWPLWITLLALSLQAIFYVLYNIFIGYLIIEIIERGYITSSIKILDDLSNIFKHKTYVILICIAAVIIFLAIAYLLTKLFYGLAFYISGKINNKRGIQALALGLFLIIILGSIGSKYYGRHKLEQVENSINNTSSSTSQLGTSVNNPLSLKTFSNGGYTYTLEFYKNARVFTDKSGTQILTYSGLVDAFAAPSIKPPPATCSDIGINWSPVFYINVNNSQQFVCESNGGTFVSYYTEAGKQHDLFLTYYKSQPPSNYSLIQEIFDSVNITKS